MTKAKQKYALMRLLIEDSDLLQIIFNERSNKIKALSQLKLDVNFKDEKIDLDLIKMYFSPSALKELRAYVTEKKADSNIFCKICNKIVSRSNKIQCSLCLNWLHKNVCSNEIAKN